MERILEKQKFLPGTKWVFKMKLEKNLGSGMYEHTTDGFHIKLTMMGKR